MMETDVQLKQLGRHVVHSASLSEEGWVLRWEESDRAVFEVLCRTESTPQLAQLEAVLTGGFCQALEQL